MKSKNYFTCEMPLHEECSCGKDLLGRPLCEGCIARNSCDACGLRGTSFCVECTNEEKDVKE